MIPTPKRQSGKRTVKGWMLIDTETGYVDYVTLHRNLAYKRRREATENLDMDLKLKWEKILKTIPCVIYFALPAKDKQK